MQAIRVSTITAATIANASAGAGPLVPDPTTFDTVLYLRFACDQADANCNNGAFVPDGTGGAKITQRSELYQVPTMPDDEMLIVVDGYDGEEGLAQVTLQEYPQLGVLNAPCIPIPPERSMDVTAPTAYFRCSVPRHSVSAWGGARRQRPLCVPLVPLGSP